MATHTVLENLHKKQSLIKDRIRAVACGEATGMYLYGRPGMSKTYLVETTLKSLNQTFSRVNGRVTPAALFDEIKAHRHSVIVLDDVNSIFKDEIGLQLLLGALGKTPDGSRTRRVRYKTAKTDETIPFDGGIIIISNLQLSDHRNQVLEALEDRVHVLGYDPSDEEVEACILDIAETPRQDMDVSEATDVARFLLEQCRELGVRPSIRLFLDKALSDYRFSRSGMNECDWRHLVRTSVEGKVTPQKEDLRDISKAQAEESQNRLILTLQRDFSDPKQRVKIWKAETSKSQATYYRRLTALQARGLLPC